MSSDYLFQALVLFGFYVVMTTIEAPDGARAGFATVAAIALIRFVVESIAAWRRTRHERRP